MKILVLNGPNLNLLGKREPEIYGYETLDDIAKSLDEIANQHEISLFLDQRNSESDLISSIHKAQTDNIDLIIFNPGAFTHTSIAIRDAFLAVDIPFFEVHITDIKSRESFRHHSYFEDIAIEQISGNYDTLERIGGTISSVIFSYSQGVKIFRVHKNLL